MNLNMHIILDELSDLKPVSFLNDDSIELSICSIACVDSPLDVFLTDTLYLANAPDLTSCEDKLKGVNLISIGLPDQDFAIRNHCNLISLNESFSLVEIVGLIFKIQKKYDEWNNRLLSAIISRQSMNDFFELALEVILNPMILVRLRPLGTLILAADEVPDSCTDSIWRELLDQGYISYEHPLYNEFLKVADHNFTKKQAFIIQFPRHEYTYMIANIFQDGKQCGAIQLIEVNHPFTSGQLTLVTHFRNILEQAIKSIPDFQILSSNANSFVYQLLKHIYLKESIIINCLKSIGWKVYDDFYCLYFIQDQKRQGKEIFLGMLMQELSRQFPSAMILDYENGVVVILRHSDSAFDRDSLKSNLSPLIEKFSLTAGASTVFYDFKNLKRHYDECKLAIKYGQDGKTETLIHFFQDYVIKHLTRFVFVENGANEFIHTKVERLYRYDEKNSTELVKTLLAYLQFGQSKSLAAEKMHLHRNTLIYRLDSINNVSGIDCSKRMTDENEICHMMLSCKFLEYQRT